MLNIMDDSGYNVDGTSERINKFVTRKKIEIKNIIENHKKRNEVKLFAKLSLCISNINFQALGNSSTTAANTSTTIARPPIEDIEEVINFT